MENKSHALGLKDQGTKERIMDVVMQLFASKGYDGVTIREIAKLANVNEWSG